MSSANHPAETKITDPFKGVIIRSTGDDENAPVSSKVNYSLPAAIHVNSIRGQEQADGFSINGSYFGLPEPLDLGMVAWELVSIIGQFGSMSGLTMHSTLDVLEAYFMLVQHHEEYVFLDRVPSHRLVAHINQAYVGHFPRVDDFLRQMREDYENMDPEDFAARVAACTGTAKNHYFDGSEWATEE